MGILLNYLGTLGGGGGGSLDTIAGFSATTISSDRIDLAWTDSSDESYYLVERSADAGATYAVLATLAADVASYSDTGLSPATTYSYRISSLAPGSSGAISNEATASATTDAAALTTAGLFFDYDAVNYNAGTNTWVDSVAAKNMSVVGSAPSVVSSWSNGKPALDFDSGQQLQATSFTAFTTWSESNSTNKGGAIFIVGEFDSSLSDYLMRFQNNSNASRLEVLGNGSGRITFNRWNTLGNSGVTTEAGTLLSAGTKFVYGVRFDGSSITRHRINAGANATGSTSTGTRGSDLTTLSVPGVNTGNIKIARIVGYRPEQADADYTTNMVALGAAYGIPIS